MLSKGRTRPSDVGGVGRKIMTSKFLDWLLNHLSESDLEKIIKKHDNKEAQLHVLDELFDKAELPDSFDTGLYRNECLDLISRIEKKSVGIIPDVISDKIRKDLGLKPEGVKIRGKRKKKKEKVKKGKVVKTFKQRSKKGKTYKRTYQRWSSKETLALKVRLKDYYASKENIQSIKKTLTKLTGVHRSEASIKRKITRLNKEKKT